MTMETRTFATIDHCARCGGLFAEPGEAQSGLGHRHDVGDLARLGLAEIVGPSKIGCPSGHGPMLVYRMKGPDGPLELDVCGTCTGVFFDAGESDLLKHLSARAGEVQTASGARFSAPPSAGNQDRAIAEARQSSSGNAFGAFWTSIVVGAVELSRDSFARRRRW